MGRAFTLMELLVTLAILGILLALIIPAIQKMRAASAKTQCANQLKQITLACHSFHDDHKRLPPALGYFPRDDVFQGGNGYGNTFFHLLPYIEQHSLYDQSRYRAHPPGEKPQDYFRYSANGVPKQTVPLYNCPADPTLLGDNPLTNYAPSSYAANYLVFGNVYPDQKKGSGVGTQGSGKAPFSSKNAQGRPKLPTTFQDGIGNTILFAEKYGVAYITPEAYASMGSGPEDVGNPPTYTPGKAYEGGCYWAYFHADCRIPFFAYYDVEPKTHPMTDPFAVGSKGTRAGFQVQPNPQGGCNPCLPATGHSAMNAAMADGSVRALTAGMDRKVWWALVTPAARDRAE